MKWLSTYRGYEIRHSTVRDGDGFARYEAEIKVDGQWQFASSEALDEDTVERDLDTFIGKIEAPGGSFFAPIARALRKRRKIWCHSAMDFRERRERGGRP